MNLDEEKLSALRVARHRAHVASEAAKEGLKRRRSLRQHLAQLLLKLLLWVDPRSDERIAQLKMRMREAEVAEATHRVWMFALLRNAEYTELLEAEFQAAGVGLFDAASQRICAELMARAPVVNDLEPSR